MSPAGVPLITWLLKYPRIIHAEFMTHRMLSKNAASSRAIPHSKMMEMVDKEMFVPTEWMKNHKGMQGKEFHDEDFSARLDQAWEHNGKIAIEHATHLNSLDVTKQLSNRVTEPFSYITVVCTGTEWPNFFGLRAHEDAEIHIQELAYRMKDAYLHAKAAHAYNELKEGEWHLPFIRTEEKEEHDLETLKKVSVARCAWTSYRTPDGKEPSIERCTKIYDQLGTSKPMHASPFEHQAMCIDMPLDGFFSTKEPDYYEIRTNSIPEGMELRANSKGQMDLWSGNLRGWVQHRKLLEGENITEIPEEGIVYPK